MTPDSDDVPGEQAAPVHSEPTTPEAAPAPPPPLLELRDGLPPLTETRPQLAEVCRALGPAGRPVAVHADRASGYRYPPRAYLIQLRREGAGAFLIHPIGFDSTHPLQ